MSLAEEIARDIGGFRVENMGDDHEEYDLLIMALNEMQERCAKEAEERCVCSDDQWQSDCRPCKIAARIRSL